MNDIRCLGLGRKHGLVSTYTRRLKVMLICNREGVPTKLPVLHSVSFSVESISWTPEVLITLVKDYEAWKACSPLVRVRHSTL